MSHIILIISNAIHSDKRCKEIQKVIILRTTLKASYNTTLIHSAKILSEVITSVLKKINIAHHTAMRLKMS